MPISIRILARLTALALLLMPLVATAQSADELIDRGLSLREAGQDAAALPLLRDAFKLSPTPRAAAQLAMVEQALGRWVDAERHLLQALRSKGDRWIRKNRKPLEGALETIQANVGGLVVRGSPAGAVIYFGGTRIGTLPMAEPARVVAQRATLRVKASGHRSISREVDVKAGGLRAESVALAPLKEGEAEGDDFGAAIRRARAAEKLGDAEERARAKELAALRSKTRLLLLAGFGYLSATEPTGYNSGSGNFNDGDIGLAASGSMGDILVDPQHPDGAAPMIGAGLRWNLGPRFDLQSRLLLGWLSKDEETADEYDGDIARVCRPVGATGSYYNNCDVGYSTLSVAADLTIRLRPITPTFPLFIGAGVAFAADLYFVSGTFSGVMVSKGVPYKDVPVSGGPEVFTSFGFATELGVAFGEQEQWEIAGRFRAGGNGDLAGYGMLGYALR